MSMSRKAVLFEESIRSKDTKRLYTMAIDRFKKDTKIDLHTSKLKGKKLQAKIIDYVIRMKKEARSYSSMNNLVSGLQKWCEVFDLDVNFKKVRSYMGEDTCSHHDRIYTKQEIQKMLDVATPRMKAIILLMLSSGIRVGAVPELKLRDLKKYEKEGIYQITVYASSKNAAYVTFCSLEAAKAIDAYLELRRQKGEELTPASPLFRSDLEVYPPQAITKNGINQRMFALLRQTGLRKPNKDRYKRQDVMLTHSFRKFANTAFVKAGLKPIVVETLLGHNTGLQANYLRVTEEELLQEYLKAQDLLTISQENQLLRQMEKLKAEVSDIDAMKAAYLKLKADNERLQAEVEKLKEKNKLRTENLDHKESLLEFFEKRYLELKERLDRMEGRVDDNNNNKNTGDDVHKHLEALRREKPEIWAKVTRWEQDRKEREKEKKG